MCQAWLPSPGTKRSPFWNLWQFLTHQIGSFKAIQKRGDSFCLDGGRHLGCLKIGYPVPHHWLINVNHHFPIYLNNSYITYSQIAIIHWWTHSQVPSVRRRFTSWIRTSSAAARKPTGCQIVAARGPGRSNGSGLWKRRASCIPTCRLELGEWGGEVMKTRILLKKMAMIRLWYGYSMCETTWCTALRQPW